MISCALAASDFRAEHGAAWTIPLCLGLGPGDSSEQPGRSTLVVFEDGHPLAPAHAPHDYIRSVGKGAYSHWYDTLYLSTSDGSDPRANGRVYRAFASAAAATAELGRDAALLIARAGQLHCGDQRSFGNEGATPFNQHSDAFADPIAAAQYDKQVYEAWTRYLERWVGRSRRLRILELGPGISLGAQALLSERGNEVTVADPFPPQWQAAFHPIVYRLLGDMVGGSAVLERAAAAGTFAELGIRQLAEPAEALASLRRQEFDVVLSNAMLEHVADLDRVCAELARITRRGGLNLHQIDLAYHKRTDRPLDHLLLSDDEFFAEAEAAHFEYGNRWRKSEFVARFNRAGFEMICADVTLTADRDYLAQIASLRRRGRYRRWPLDDLGALSMFLVARRPGQGRSLVPMLKGHATVALQGWRKRMPIASRYRAWSRRSRGRARRLVVM